LRQEAHRFSILEIISLLSNPPHSHGQGLYNLELSFPFDIKLWAAPCSLLPSTEYNNTANQFSFVMKNHSPTILPLIYVLDG